MKNNNRESKIYIFIYLICCIFIGIPSAIFVFNVDYSKNEKIELFSFDAVLSFIGFLIIFIIASGIVITALLFFTGIFLMIWEKLSKHITNQDIALKIFLIIIPVIVFCGTAIYFNISRSNTNKSNSDETNKYHSGISFNKSSYQDRFKVTALADIDYNNSVGNSWAFYFEVNDKEITEDGTVVFVEAGDRVDLYVECTDYDDVPETGYNSAYIEIEKGDYFNGFYVEVPVVITENRGKYYGNKAQFTVTFYFEPITQN